MTSQTEVLHLYRSFLRIASRWPQDKLRPTRDFKQVLRARIVEAFHNPSGRDLTLENAYRQLNALQRLARSEFMKKHKLSEKTLNPASKPNYYARLVTDLDKGPKRPLFGKFFRRG